MINFSEFFQYIDIFGTKPGFYINQKAKFYTILGGIFSLSALSICFIVFIFFSMDDLKRVAPTTTTSLIQSQPNKINIIKEKIYIPWRIVDNENKFINHTDLIFPEIEYLEIEKKNLNEPFNYKTLKLNYTLCNQTSMKNLPKNYFSFIPLDQLYCIDLDKLNLEMGGAWLSLFIKYLRIVIYLCKNGENYDEKNDNCTNREKLIKKIGEDNSLFIEFFYPTLQFEPTNITDPVAVEYKQYYYNFNENSNKLDSLFLQKYVLNDDLGWFKKNIKNSSFWGFNSLKSDTYLNQKDLFSNESSSLLYTLNIYLDSSVIIYKREYKKILLIIVEGLPIMYVVFVVFSLVAKIFKLTEETKIMMELLFENLKEKTSHFPNNLNNVKRKNDIIFSSNNKINQSSSRNVIDVNRASLSKNLSPNNIIYRENNRLSIAKFNKSDSSLGNKKIQNNANNEIRTNFFQKNYFFLSNKKKYTTMLLFPYRYYFYSVFIKSISKLKKNRCCFSKKYVNVYNYLAHIIDISTYLHLQREFYIFKTEILDAEKQIMIEKERKLNINGHFFSNNMIINEDQDENDHS